MTAAPHVSPAPKTTSRIRSPRWILPDATASSSAMATDAAEVLPYLWRLTNNLFRRGAEPLADRVNDAAVGLVRDDALDLGDVNFAAAQDLVGRAAHRLDGVFEGFLAVHAQEMQAGPATVCAEAGQRLPPPGMESKSALLPSAPITVVSRPWEFGRFCRIAAPAPSPNSTQVLRSCPVGDGRKFFRADDQHGFVGARHDELLADFQGVNETGTRGLDVERRRRAARRFFAARGRRWLETACPA